MGASNVNNRSQDRNLIDKEELSPGSPAGPFGQDRLHELNHPDQVLILSPERPFCVLINGFVDGKVGGVEEAQESSLLLTIRSHQVLKPDSMWPCG